MRPFPRTHTSHPRSEQAVYTVLTELKNSANHTPDGIPQLFDRKFALFQAEPLHIRFTEFYETGKALMELKQTL